jgi:2-phosphosulfolactate phosphatase
MMTSLEVLFTPADFAALSRRDLSDTVCVVFDVLRATSSMVQALRNGAAALLPVETIPEALEAKHRQRDVLLAGERDGVRIKANLTGSIDFDLGNSPREFTRERVLGRTIVMTTTNGTRALRACASARSVLAGSFLNVTATAEFLGRERPLNLLLVCSGTFEEAAFEDVLGAGALCELLWSEYGTGEVADSARMAHNLFLLEQGNLAAAFARSRNGRRLLSIPGLRDDVEFCLRMDSAPLLAELNRQGVVLKRE